LTGFKPGFGVLAQFCYFRGCISAIIACPISLICPLCQYISKTPYLGKCKIFSSPVAKPWMNPSQLVSLVQYVKQYNHPKHDAKIKQFILTATAPQHIYKYFLKNKAMQQDILTEDGKDLNDGYRVPGPKTDFKPFEFEPVPKGQDTHMEPRCVFRHG
jgi:hypothetical protein